MDVIAPRGSEATVVQRALVTDSEVLGVRLTMHCVLFLTLFPHLPVLFWKNKVKLTKCLSLSQQIHSSWFSPSKLYISGVGSTLWISSYPYGAHWSAHPSCLPNNQIVSDFMNRMYFQLNLIVWPKSWVCEFMWLFSHWNVWNALRHHITSRRMLFSLLMMSKQIQC